MLLGAKASRLPGPLGRWRRRRPGRRLFFGFGQPLLLPSGTFNFPKPQLRHALPWSLWHFPKACCVGRPAHDEADSG